VERLECVEVYNADEYLFAYCCLSDHWRNQTLSEAVAEIESGLEYHQVLYGDIEGALVSRAKSDVYDNPGDLTESIIAELLSRAEISEDAAKEWRSR